MATPVPPVDKDAASFPPIESSFSTVNESSNTVTPAIVTGQAGPTAPVEAFGVEPVKLEDHPAPSRLNSTDAETPGFEIPGPTAGRKRKLHNLSARGVANLTPDQLAKKRANDRQAQRAIRERTKIHIDALEQQVRDLSSQKPMVDLQAAWKQNETIREENKELRQGLKAAMDIIRPLLEKSESTSGEVR